MSRPDWSHYFMQIAEAVSVRGTCDRLRVGAVIVDASRAVVATGYNGAPRGWPQCDEEGHLMADIDGRQSCIRTVHAEENAMVDAARRGVAISGCTLFTTASTCYGCLLRCATAGIDTIVYRSEYTGARNGHVDVPSVAARMGIAMLRLEDAKEAA